MIIRRGASPAQQLGEAPWHTTTYREAPASEWRPSSAPDVLLACGHRVLGWPLIRAGGRRYAYCDADGGWLGVLDDRGYPRVRVSSEFGYTVIDLVG